MNSDSAIKELHPGDPKLTASIVSHLKSRGLFDQLRRDCLGDVDTKPAYLNLKQRIEGYITKFLSTQTWTPDMNKNHVRDIMRREINESGMLSAGMDHLVDQIVNPKIYHVFTPEVENGVRQYLGLSLPREASQPPAQLADMDSVGCALPHAAPLQKSEFSIDETTQDVPGSCSPKLYPTVLTPEGLTDSSSEPQLVIVTESNERPEETQDEFPEAVESPVSQTASPEPPLSEYSPQLPTNVLPDTVDVNRANSPEKLKVVDVRAKKLVDDRERVTKKCEEKREVRVHDRKKDEETSVKKEAKLAEKERKDKKSEPSKVKDVSSHLGKSDMHPKSSSLKKSSLDTSRSSKTHRTKNEGDLQKDSRDSSRDRGEILKDKHNQQRDRGDFSKDETSRDRVDLSRAEKIKSSSSSRASKTKESDSRSDRKRSEEKHRHHSNTQRHNDKRRHDGKNSRADDRSKERSDSRRSHGESHRDKERSSGKESSRTNKSGRSRERDTSRDSRKEKGQEKERKQSDSKHETSECKANTANLRKSSNDGTYGTPTGLETVDQIVPQVAFEEASQETSRDVSHDTSRGASQEASQEAFRDAFREPSREPSQESSQGPSQESSQVPFHKEPQGASPEAILEDTQGSVELVEAREAEILRFSYVTDKTSGNCEIDLQLVSATSANQPEFAKSIGTCLEHGTRIESSELPIIDTEAVALPCIGVLEQPPRATPERAKRKTRHEKRSPDKKRHRRVGPDGHESDGAWSDVTVSSVHTSDLSSFDDRISVSSAEEEEDNRQKKKVPLREIKKIASSSNEDEDRMSKCESDLITPEHITSTTTREIVKAVEMREELTKPADISNSVERGGDVASQPMQTAAPAQPPVVTEEGAPEPKMGLRRTRKINPKYVSEEFSSIFTESKRPTGTIDFSELAKYGKERHHEDALCRMEHRKPVALPSPRHEYHEELVSGTTSCDDTGHISDASTTDRSRRPPRRPSGGDPRPKSEPTSSKRYESSDLYKPRPVIKSGTRRSRPSAAATLEATEEEEDAEEEYKQEQQSAKRKRLRVCIGLKRGRASATTSSKRRRL